MNAAGGEVIERDVACLGCGYNLRGLVETGSCPECSAPVQRTITGDALKFTGVRHIRRLHQGAFLLSLMFGAHLAAIPVGTWLTLDKDGPSIPWLDAVHFALLPVLGCFAWWLLTSPDLERLPEQRKTPLRLAARASFLVQALLLGALIVFPDSRYLVGIASASLAVWQLAGAVQLAYMRSLARRLPDDLLYSTADRLMWSKVVLAVLGAFALILSFPLVAGALGKGAVAVMVICALGSLVTGVLYIVLVDRLRRGLKMARREAEARDGVRVPVVAQPGASDA